MHYFTTANNLVCAKLLFALNMSRVNLNILRSFNIIFCLKLSDDNDIFFYDKSIDIVNDPESAMIDSSK